MMMTGESGADKTPRSYRSPARAAKARETRMRILTAARAEFVARGYTATTMQTIAASAGVSTRTVEMTIGTKRDLLKTVVDVNVVGDDEPIPMKDREWVHRAQASTHLDEALAAIAAGVRAATDRVADLAAVVHQAAESDPEIAELAREFDRQRLVGAQNIVARLTAFAPSVRDNEFAVDTTWLLMDPVVYRRLRRVRGWSPDDYERWLVSSMRRLTLVP